ncbi:MAG: glycosyltransferase family 39 protein [Phycisphaeraceae bacterium]|nr:glycosyltransferase family 39 protein [Phycisphaeraceae bacterium]
MTQSSPADNQRRPNVPPPAIAPTPSADHVPSIPQGRTGKLVAWLGLMLCLVLALPPLLIDVWRPDAVDRREMTTVAVSMQSLSQRGQPRAGPTSLAERLAPQLNGRARWDRPPAVHWMQRALLGGMDLEHARLHEVLLRARLVSAAWALAAIAAVYWIGRAIGGTGAAVMGALVCVSSPMLIFHGRLATPTMMLTGLMLMAVAAGTWAIRPLRPAPSIERQFVGWVLCGLCLGAAVLTAGLLAVPLVVAPLLLILLLCPGRVGHLMGLVAAVLIAGLMVLPWAGMVQEVSPENWSRWLWSRERTDDVAVGWIDAGWRLAALLAAMLPWTLWLVGALLQPISTSSSGTRTRLFLGWGWLTVMAVMVAAAGGAAGQWRSRQADLLVPATAAAAVLIGQLFWRYIELASQGRSPRSWRWMRWPHTALLGVLSLLPAAWAWLEPGRWTGGWIDAPSAGTIWRWAEIYLTGLSVALLLIVVLAARWAAGHMPGRALAAWAAWGVVMMSVLAFPLTRGAWASDPLRDEIGRLRSVMAGQEVFWLEKTETAVAAVVVGVPARPAVDVGVLFYLGRTVPTITASELANAWAEHGEFYIIADSDQSPPSPEAAEPVGELASIGRKVWRYHFGPPAQTQPVPATTAPITP